MSANTYNAAKAISIGWGQALACLTRSPRPCGSTITTALAEAWVQYGPSDEFTREVEEAQILIGVGPDGFLGSGTWANLVKRANREIGGMPRPIDTQAVLIAGLIVELDVPHWLRIIHDEKLCLSTHRTPRSEKTRLVIHWGGLNVSHGKRTLDERNLSTHFLLSPLFEDPGSAADYHVYQTVDLARTAIHAGAANGGSIGIDICRSPRVKYAPAYINHVIKDNHTGRGDPRYVELPDDVGASAREFIHAIARLYDIEVQPYPGHALIDPSEWKRSGVYGHHHIKAQKWDVAPWAHHFWEDVDDSH